MASNTTTRAGDVGAPATGPGMVCQYHAARRRLKHADPPGRIGAQPPPAVHAGPPDGHAVG